MNGLPVMFLMIGALYMIRSGSGQDSPTEEGEGLTATWPPFESFSTKATNTQEIPSVISSTTSSSMSSATKLGMTSRDDRTKQTTSQGSWIDNLGETSSTFLPTTKDFAWTTNRHSDVKLSSSTLDMKPDLTTVSSSPILPQVTTTAKKFCNFNSVSFDSGTLLERDGFSPGFAAPQDCTPGINNTPTSATDDTFKAYFNVSFDICGTYSCNSETGCRCDKSCLIYGDCCYETIDKTFLQPQTERHNSTNSKAVESLRNISSLYSSVGLEETYEQEMKILDYSSCVSSHESDPSGFWMISSCSASYSGDSKVRQLCEEAPNYYSIDNIPALQMSRKTAFKNVFCAICNGVNHTELGIWKVNVNCSGNNNISSPIRTLDEIKANCNISLAPLHSSVHRLCYKRATCMGRDTNGSRQDLGNLCNSYIHTVKFGESQYRNPHCALCLNGHSKFNNVTCLQRSNGLVLEGSDMNAVDLRILFDFNPDTGYTFQPLCTGHEKECGVDEIFDCVRNKCTTLYCHDGFIPQYGNCVNSTDDASPITYRMSQPQEHNGLPDNQLLLTVTVENLERENNVSVLLQTIANNLYTDHNISVSVDLWQSLMTQNGTDYRLLVSMTSKTKLIEFLALLLRYDVTDFSGRLNVKITNANVQNYYTSEELYCTNGTLTNDSSVHFSESSSGSFNLKFNATRTEEQLFNTRWRMNVDLSNKNSHTLQDVYVCLTEVKLLRLNCSMVAFEKGEFHYDAAEALVHVINSSIVYRKGEFVLHGDKAFVCSDSVTDTGHRRIKFFPYSPTQRILSIITASISLFALAFTILLHLIFPSLRNAHGLNLTALSVTMLVVQGLLLIENISGIGCVVFAVVLHFFLLWMFTWMNIIGLDMAILFSSKFSMTHQRPIQRFKKYFFISVLIPALIIIVCLCLEYSSSFEIGYGKGGVCWISNPIAIVVFVSAPVGLSILLNLLLFSVTVWAIQSAKKASKRASKTGSGAYCLVYFKLTVILGLTWIVSIVAAFLSVEGLWYAHIVLNGLQGLSIFLCFALNSRVIRTVKKRGMNRSETRTQVSCVSETNSKPSKVTITTTECSPDTNSDCIKTKKWIEDTSQIDYYHNVSKTQTLNLQSEKNQDAENCVEKGISQNDVDVAIYSDINRNDDILADFYEAEKGQVVTDGTCLSKDVEINVTE